MTEFPAQFFVPKDVTCFHPKTGASTALPLRARRRQTGLGEHDS